MSAVKVGLTKYGVRCNKKIAIRVLVMLIGLHSSYGVSYAGTTPTGHIKSMQVNKALGNVLFVQLDVQHISPISCHINQGWSYTIPMQNEADKKIFAMLMVARTLGQTVTLYGSGACSDFSAVESIGGMNLDSVN